MRKLMMATFGLALMLAAPASAQNLYDPYGTSLQSWDSQPSWYDRQEQSRLKNEIRDLEDENRRLRALRAQETDDRGLRAQQRRTDQFRAHWNKPFPD